MDERTSCDRPPAAGTIFLWPAVSDTALRQLAALSPELKLVCGHGDASSENEAGFRSADIVYGNVPPTWIDDATRFRWLQLASVGVERYRNVTWPSDVLVTNMRGVFALSIAETVIGGLLSVHRQLAWLRDLQQERSWQQWPVRARATCLTGCTVLILGAGAIALQLRRVLAAFDCRVTLFGRTNTSADITSRDDLLRAAGRSNVVVNTLPETWKTVGCVSRQLLELLPPDAIFVNVGRGLTVDEDALYELLTSGRLRGCVLDVTTVEPLECSSRWWQAPNCILTQHTAGGHRDEAEAGFAFFVSNLRRYLAGEPLENRLELDRGY